MIEIKLTKFPTHLPITNPKKAKPKYVKLNGQLLYNSNVNRFARNTLMDNIHKYVMNKIPKRLKIYNFPIKVKFIIKTVINHGSIQRRNEVIIWKYPDDNYVPNYDLDNMLQLWVKGSLDCLVKAKIIPDDSVQYINNIEYEFEAIEEFDNREIIIQIYEKN